MISLSHLVKNTTLGNNSLSCNYILSIFLKAAFPCSFACSPNFTFIVEMSQLIKFPNLKMTVNLTVLFALWPFKGCINSSCSSNYLLTCTSHCSIWFICIKHNRFLTDSWYGCALSIKQLKLLKEIKNVFPFIIDKFSVFVVLLLCIN